MRVNEIFYSLQGEGRYTGVPAVFVRLSGCNRQCPFCDTQHRTYTEMTEQEIVAQVIQYPTHHVVLTGGEPLLQVNSTLIGLLHDAGRYVQVETNGTLPLGEDIAIDWITCSPKDREIRLSRVDEIKVVYQGVATEPLLAEYAAIGCREHRLQPCDTQDAEQNRRNLQGAIGYCLAHPQWSLSLQTHKIINIQ